MGIAREGRTPDTSGAESKINENPLCSRAQIMVPIGFLSDKSYSLDQSDVVLFLLSVIYGGAHAAPRNSPLPLPVERFLWRISACIAGLCYPAIASFVHY